MKGAVHLHDVSVPRICTQERIILTMMTWLQDQHISARFGCPCILGSDQGILRRMVSSFCTLLASAAVAVALKALTATSCTPRQTPLYTIPNAPSPCKSGSQADSKSRYHGLFVEHAASQPECSSLQACLMSICTSLCRLPSRCAQMCSSCSSIAQLEDASSSAVRKAAASAAGDLHITFHSYMTDWPDL